jgi:hypothetical protein
VEDADREAQSATPMAGVLPERFARLNLRLKSVFHLLGRHSLGEGGCSSVALKIPSLPSRPSRENFLFKKLPFHAHLPVAQRCCPLILR